MAKTWTSGTGGNWKLGTNWAPTGVPGPTDTAVIDSSAIGTFVVTIDDTETPGAVTLNDVDATLSITSTGILIPGGPVNLEQGTLALTGQIIDGTVENNGASFNFTGGTLDGDTWQGALEQTANFGTVTIKDGLTLLNAAGTGPGTIEISNLYSVNIADATLLQDMTIDFGNFNNEYLSGSNVLPLELASSVVITQTLAAANGNILGARLENAGTILAESSGGNLFVGSGEFDNTGSVTVSNRDNLVVNQNFNNSGNILVGSSSFLTVNNSGTFNNTGTIAVTLVGTLSSGKDITGDGTVELSVLGSADVHNIAGTVVFEDSKGLLKLEAPGTFTGTIEGFQKGDRIDLVGQTVTQVTYNNSTKFLTVDDGATQIASLHIAGNYPSGEFTFGFTPDGATGFDLTVACYAAGTRVRTADGDVAVEDLRVGAALPAHFAGTARVKWLGHRRIACAQHPDPAQVWPVRVRQSAFAPGLPGRDLLLSPDHAVLVDGVLIPVKYLINDATIVQEPVASVTYWHVELERHDAILAEGLLCESYLDTGNRAAFANGGGATMLHADFARLVWAAEACAELVVDGANLIAARSLLLERAEALGYGLTADPELRLVVDGRELAPTRHGGTYRFEIEGGAGQARLTSRVSVPAHDRDDGDDHRRLGVAVARLALDGRALRLADRRLGAGWHAAEPTWRWTDGDAVLDLRGARRVEVDLAFAVSYRERLQPAALLRAAG